MEFNATIDLIIRELEDARKIIDDLKKYPGVPLLQIELAKSKCKNAGEVISLLKEEDGSRKTEARSPESEERSPKSEVRSPESKERRESTEVDELRQENITIIPDSTSLKPDKQEHKKIAPEKKHQESHVIGDSFGHLSSKLNDQLGSRKPEDDLSGIIKNKPLSSLTEAIGINDSFFFIREIFNGNKEAYSHAIARLENIESIPDARAVLISYTGENNENEAIRQLLDLVKRKLTSNE